jgi:hypothetical protein
MEQLRDAPRKLTEDYKDLKGSCATLELQQSKIAHESSGEDLKQIKTIFEKLTKLYNTNDHEKLRGAVQGISSRSKEAAKPIGPPAESRVEYKKAKNSRDNHTAMHVDVQDQQRSASACPSL